MTKLRIARSAWIGALISMPACLWAEKPLPGIFEPVPLVFRESIDFAAVCIAEDDPTFAGIEQGKCSVTQRFRLLGLVVGRTGGRSRGKMHYQVSSDGFDRAVRKGERVIWLARCTEGDWKGHHVFDDTPGNRELVYTEFARGFCTPAHQGLEVRVETSGDCFAPGQPIPIQVQIDNTSESPMVLWSNFSALQFDVLAEDGERVRCRRTRAPAFDRTEPRIVQQYSGPTETGDLADLCDWLPKGAQRAYTLIWRGKVRLGDRKAKPFEVVSDPIRLIVRDPSTLAWGDDLLGAKWGLGAERPDVSMGDRVIFHFGVMVDSVRVGPDRHIYRYFTEDDLHFTFRNTETGTVYERLRDMFRRGPTYSPKAEDFLRLRDHPVLLWTVPVRLLDDDGEQIPAGTYEVTATYSSRVAEQSSLPPKRGPWKLLQGPFVSAPVTLRVRQAAPESIEVYINSAIELQDESELCSWTGSQTKPPTVLRVGRSTWDSGFPHGLGSEACRALAAGESVKVRVDVSIYETADVYGVSPSRGDSRLIWQGRLEARRP